MSGMQDQAGPQRSHRYLRAMRLRLAATDPAFGAALDAARRELAETLALEPRPLNAAAIAAARSALALGDDRAARETIRLLAAHQDDDGAIISSAPESDSIQEDLTHDYLLLLARFLAWTGELHTLREVWPSALRALDLVPRDPSRPDAASWAAVLSELAVAAESIGDEAAAREIRSGSPLPPAGIPAPAQDAPPAPDGGAAELVDYIIEGILGIEADAPRDRLVLRPRLPESWNALELSGLRIGDAEITLSYRREGDRHSFTLDQESGAVPVRVIFEPAIPGGELLRAVVDGEEAELDAIPTAGRLRVPIQIVLDTTRVVELIMGEGRKRGGIVLPMR